MLVQKNDEIKENGLHYRLNLGKPRREIFANGKGVFAANICYAKITPTSVLSKKADLKEDPLKYILSHSTLKDRLTNGQYYCNNMIPSTHPKIKGQALANFLNFSSLSNDF